MSVSDPIADMLTSMRNAQRVGMEMVSVPHSALKVEIVRVLKKEGYVADYAVEGGVKKVLRVYLRYNSAHEPVMRGLRRASSPGLRAYTGAGRLPRVLGGMGTAVMSTSQGVMTGREARSRKVGGEVLCTVW